ncbi:hypothetical protein D3C81_1443580 [compost metagenome]
MIACGVEQIGQGIYNIFLRGKLAGQGWLLGICQIIAQVRADQHGINQIVKLGELVPEIDSGPFHIGEIRADDLRLHRPAAVLRG